MVDINKIKKEDMLVEKASLRKVRLYLDNCAYNRPYDDQSQVKIELETQAKLRIQRMIKNRQLDLASSYMSLYECGENPDASRAELITSFINQYSTTYISLKNQQLIEEKAREIMKTGIKFKDACHIACAIKADADYFVSTDKRIMKYKTDEIKMINPIEFFTNELENLKNEGENKYGYSGSETDDSKQI